MVNKHLKRVKLALSGYFCYFKHQDVLVIAEDKSVLPFAYLIASEPGHPGQLLLSVAIDYSSSDKVANIALVANKVMPVVISESFYVSKMGVTHMGEEAERYFDMDTFLPLEELDPESKAYH